MKQPDWTNPQLAFGDTCGMACEVQTREEAQRYLAAYTNWMLNVCTAADRPKTYHEAEAIIRTNIGYWTGYIDLLQAGRVLEFYDTEHPVFGKVWPKTPDEAFKMGQELAEGKRTLKQVTPEYPSLPKEIRPGQRLVE